MSGDDSNVPQPVSRALDFFGLGEAAQYLIGPITSGVGKLWAPRQMRRENKAQIDSFNAWDEALREKGYEPGSVDLTIGQRTEVRLLAENIERQANREAVAAFTIEQAKLDAGSPMDPALAPPESEWIDRFWRLAETCSDEKIQAFWGMILSRRSTRQQALSARALEFISLLSNEEAEALARLSQFFVRVPLEDGSSNVGLMWDVTNNWSPPGANQYGERVQEMMNPLYANVFGPLGIFAEEGYAHTFAQIPKDGYASFSVADVQVKVKASAEHLQSGCLYIGHGVAVTPLGSEIIEMLRPSAHPDYVEVLRQAYAVLDIEFVNCATNS